MKRFFTLTLSALTICAPTMATQATAATKPVKAPAAATVDANAAFCAQLATSQKAIGATTGALKQKNAKIAAEWVKLEATAPAPIKPDIAAVRAAFTKAATQDDASAKATLAGVGAPSKKIGEFVAKACAQRGGPGGGNDDHGPDGGFDPAKMAELRACMEKNGASMPDPNNGGARPNFDDPKFQAAAQKCGFGGPDGGGFGGGRGVRGGRGISDAVRACVTAKGITLPTRPDRTKVSKPANGTNGDGANAAKPAGGGDRGGRAPMDAKTQAAIDACRAANPEK
jgi:hypothetical protein